MSAISYPPIGDPNGMHDPPPEPPKANQACATCRKQKRRCDKALPSCALCSRMNRHCDYTDISSTPTADEFRENRRIVQELERQVQESNREMAHLKSMLGVPIMQGGYIGGNLPSPQAAYATTSSASVMAQQAQGYAIQESLSRGTVNEFPSILFLDGNASQNGRVRVLPPKPNCELPLDVAELLRDEASLASIIGVYFATVYRWLPIVSRKRIEMLQTEIQRFEKQRMEMNLGNTLWAWGADTAYLLLCMKLICSKPEDGLDPRLAPIYLSAQRLHSLVEDTGTASLSALQAALLKTWYEYGHGIYPAAYMSAGWCERYGIMLGIGGNTSYEILPQVEVWSEQEERRRTWWGVLITDRVIKIGSQAHVLNAQEPNGDAQLPAPGKAWDEGDAPQDVARPVSSDVDNHVGPFARLCEVYFVLGRVFNHHYGSNALLSDTQRLEVASQLYQASSTLGKHIFDEALNSNDHLTYTTALALNYDTIYALCEPYSFRPTKLDSDSDLLAGMQIQAIDGLKTVSDQVAEFANEINRAVDLDLDGISPIVMHSLYMAAKHHAWLTKDGGDENSQMALQAIRDALLNRLNTRWRSAEAYVKIFDAAHYF
ncbi:hypothetical protein B0O99DRAFT_684943 [Bisporella sp. PMI_857]|nr:hypothetical protein B0O99DRAFT_684943 [Bisporella sp. PMI_857]